MAEMKVPNVATKTRKTRTPRPKPSWRVEAEAYAAEVGWTYDKLVEVAICHELNTKSAVKAYFDEITRRIDARKNQVNDLPDAA